MTGLMYYLSNNPQGAFQMFSDCYRDAYDKCFPPRTIKCGYKIRKPWLSEGLKRSIQTKNKLYHRKQKSKRLEYETIYKKYRNKLNKLLLLAEKNHYEQRLEENKCNLKGSWRVLRDIIHKKKSVSSCSRFLINNKITSDKQAVANGFNSFFINTGANLAKSIPSDPRSPTTFIKRNPQSMAIMPIIQDDVINVIRNLKASSPGWDSISAVVVKATYTCFIEPLTHILNLSVMYGVFPSELKLAKVIPLFKANDPMLFSNYRPVSVLPVFSEIFERIMYNQLLSFINKHKLLYSYQFGFRINHAPELALLCLAYKISDALESGEYVLGLFLDFSKAFDTVNHEILFAKLEFLGIRGVCLQWFRSYLSEREQYVVYNDTSSSKQRITCGVPQGSILGPLLFLLYINDLANASDVIFSLLFADDSNMFISGKNPNDLVIRMNTEIVKVVDWLKINKLSLNLKKTHFIIFRKSRQKLNLENELFIDGIKIEMKTHTKFLGVLIDQHLTFEEHCKFIKGKIARGIGILYKGKKYLNQKSLLNMYYAFIYPYFTYCITVWGNTFSYILDPLMKLQKRALRLVDGARKYDHTAPIFEKYELLNLRNLYIYCVQIFLYKHHQEILPEVFSHFFEMNNAVHEYYTRQEKHFHVPLCKSVQKSKCLKSSGVKIYNYMIEHMNYNCSFVSFKYVLKRHLLRNDMALLLVAL